MVTLTSEVLITLGIQLALTIITVFLASVRTETKLEEKMKSIVSDMQEVKAALGNGSEEGIFLRKDIAMELRKQADKEHERFDKKLIELDTEIRVIKSLIIRDSKVKGRG